MNENIKFYKRKTEKGGKDKNKPEPKKKKNDIKAVIICPCTPGSELARRLRAGEVEMRRPTGYIVKVAEKAGHKVIDQVHKSNPWRGKGCQRDGCWQCWTKIGLMKKNSQCCKSRNLIYERQDKE